MVDHADDDDDYKFVNINYIDGDDDEKDTNIDVFIFCLILATHMNENEHEFSCGVKRSYEDDANGNVLCVFVSTMKKHVSTIERLQTLVYS